MQRGWVALVVCASAVGCSSNDGETLLTSRTSAAPHALLLHGETLYFATDDQVLSLPRLGHAAPTVLASGQRNVVALAADEQSLYWATAGTTLETSFDDDGTIASVPLAGGPVTVLATNQTQPEAPAVDDASVYWTAIGPGAIGGQLMAVPKAGGAATPLLTDLPGTGPAATAGGVVAFATTAYNPDGCGTTDIRIFALPGGGMQMLASMAEPINAIATDGTTVFWTESSAGIDFASPDARIRSVPVAGGPESILADNRSNPAFLTVVGDHLFWGDTGSFGNVSYTNDAGFWTMPKRGGGAWLLDGHFSALLAFATDGSAYAWVQWTETSARWALEVRGP